MANNLNFETVIKQAGQKKKSIIFDFRRTYTAYLILILLIIASFLIKQFVKENIESTRRSEFDKAVNSIASRIENHLERHIQVLQSINGLYYQNVEVVRDYFELYGTVPAKTYSSILSLSYVPFVDGKDISSFVFSARSQGYYDYTLKPEGIRKFYYPILHSVDYSKNIHRIGFDYATVPEISSNIEHARDENRMIATKVFSLRQDTVGFCLIMPIYRQGVGLNSIDERRMNFYSALILEIDAKTFFETALRGSSDEFFPSDTAVIFEYYQEIDGQKSTIFKSNNYNLLQSGYHPLFSDEIVLNVANKKFIGRFYTIPNFGGKLQEYLPNLSLAASFALSFLLFGFIISVITSRARAEDIAERITRSQRRILEATKDVIGVLDFSGKWKTVNPAAEAVFGYSISEFLEMPFANLFMQEKDFIQFMNLINNNSLDENTQKIDLQMKNSKNELVWISWNLTISKTDGFVYAIGRDVTLEKLAEQEAEIKRKQIELAEQYALEASHAKSYFMIKLSHQLRNSLTGIIGYLQLISNKFYETEEEMLSYLQYAEQSSEEIFTFVSDIVDAALDQGESSLDAFVTTKIEPVLKNSFESYKKQVNKKNILINIDTNDTSPTAVVSPVLLDKSLNFIYSALFADMDGKTLDVVVQENTYDGAVEIQLLGPGNNEIAELIKLYRDNQNNIINVINRDKYDVMLNFAKAASIIRRMNGAMTIETFGGEEGNLAMITLPMVRKN